MNVKIVAYIFIWCFILPLSLCAQYQHKITYWRWLPPAHPKPVLKETKDYFIEYYNRDSLLIEIREVNGDRIVYEYNDKKQKMAELSYNTYDKLLREKVFEYNDKGLLKLSTYFYQSKESFLLKVTKSYFYDDNGQLIQSKTSTSFAENEAKVYGRDTITSYKYFRKDSTLTVTELMIWHEKKKPIKKVTVYNSKGWIVRQREKRLRAEYTYHYNPGDKTWLIRKSCIKYGDSPWDCWEERRTIISE